MYIYGYAQDINFNKSRYKSGDILYFRPDDPLISTNFIKFLKTYNFEKGVTVVIVIHNPDMENIYKELFNYNFKLICRSWDTWFVYESLNSLINIKEPYVPTKLEKCFTSLNHRPRPQRCKFIDEMAKHGLIEDNFVTWHSEELKGYTFKYFDGKQRVLDKVETNVRNEPLPFETFLPPKTAFSNSLWSIVCEMMYNDDDNYVRAITEKTYLPIAHKRPFISLGCKGIYKDLKKLGFVLYDEIIDYSFDDIENFDERLEQFMLQVKNINELNHKETYELLLPKINENYKNMLKLTRDRIMSVNGTKISDTDLVSMKRLLNIKRVKAPLYTVLKHNKNK